MPSFIHQSVSLALSGLCLLLFASVLQAAEPGRISGRITQAGQAIAEHRIMLIRFGPNREVHRTPGQTDAQGQFVFEQLETGEQFEYFVGIRYDEQLHRSEPIVLESGEQRTGVRVEVGTQSAVPLSEAPDTTGEAVRIGGHHIIVVRQERKVRIREILKILNPAATAYVGTVVPGIARPLSLYLPLPPGHVELADVQGLSSEHLHAHASGLYYTAPLAPGEHSLAYTYSLPLRDATTILLVERSLPTALLDVLVAEQELVVASNLPFQGRIALDAHTFLRFQGTNLPGASRVWLQLTLREEGAQVLTIAAYGLVIALALASMLVPVTSLWRRPEVRGAPARTIPDTSQRPDAAQLHLLHNIVRLDVRREAGHIDAAAYHQHRDAYKQQLQTLMQQRSG